MNLNIDVLEGQGEKIMYVSGEIDVYTAPELKKELLANTEKHQAQVTVDLSRVSYMDSTGLGVFISALKSAKENKSHVKLVNLQERVFRLFTITGLNEIMDIQPSTRGVNK